MEVKALVLFGLWTTLQEGIRMMAYHFFNAVDGVGPGPKLSRLAADPKFDLDRHPDRAYMKLLRVIANDFDIWWPAGDSTKLFSKSRKLAMTRACASLSRDRVLVRVGLI